MSEVADEIKRYYLGKTYYKDNEKIEINNVTETLISKIIMGTLATCPAYDRFFKISAKNFGICATFGKNSFEGLKKFIEDNKTEIIKAQNEIEQNRGIRYSEMKILDMYFWQKAYNLNNYIKAIDYLKNNKNNIDKCLEYMQKEFKSGFKNVDEAIKFCEQKIKKSYMDCLK